MNDTLVCWKCGASLQALELPFRRLEQCEGCEAELHVCRMCVNFNSRVAGGCTEDHAEEVMDKERANFCDYYQPRPGAYVRIDEPRTRATRAQLDALFDGDAAVNDDGARRRLKDLFGD